MSDIGDERGFPLTVDCSGRERPILPDDFPFEADREQVLGIPVLSLTEYHQLRGWCMPFIPPERLFTWCGIPLMHAIDAQRVKDAIQILEAAKRLWIGQPRDWDRADAIFHALNGRDGHD